MPTSALLHLLYPHLREALAALICLAWAGGLGLLVAHRGRYPSLPLAPPGASTGADLPTLSVLSTACNEAESVERALRSLLQSDYPHLEVIAVDDRSTDATGLLLDRLARHHPRLHALHIQELPPQWLGKCHALHIASEQATGEWLLFTDADTVFAPEALTSAMVYALARGVDHLVLAPACETRGFWERLFVSYFGLMLMFRTRPWEVADLRKRAYVGFGTFNLVRASAYRQFGGHTALRMEVLDDMKLGKLMKQNGFRTELAQGSGLLAVRWVVGFRGVWNSLRKNAFAGFEFRAPVMWSSVLGILLTGVFPLAALADGSAICRVFGALTLLLMAAGARAGRSASGAGALFGLAYPLAALLFAGIILNSALCVYRDGGILWRNTFYALDDLRRGIV